MWALLTSPTPFGGTEHASDHDNWPRHRQVDFSSSLTSTTRKVIKDLTERARETNHLVAGLQKMLTPLLARSEELRTNLNVKSRTGDYQADRAFDPYEPARLGYSSPSLPAQSVDPTCSPQNGPVGEKWG